MEQKRFKTFITSNTVEKQNKTKQMHIDNLLCAYVLPTHYLI